MIEYNLVHGNYYGTKFEEIAKDARTCVLDIDVNGIADIRAKIDTHCVFVLPPSLAILRQRLENRGTETEETLNTRIGNAESEISMARE
jgi:guanylate kinase